MGVGSLLPPCGSQRSNRSSCLEVSAFALWAITMIFAQYFNMNLCFQILWRCDKIMTLKSAKSLPPTAFSPSSSVSQYLCASGGSAPCLHLPQCLPVPHMFIWIFIWSCLSRGACRLCARHLIKLYWLKARLGEHTQAHCFFCLLGCFLRINSQNRDF